MATSRAAEVLEKIGERHLECSICFQRFTEPKFLDCLHTFCLKCLHNLKLREGPQILKLKCPMCRHETMLKSDSLEDLPPNFTLSALVEEFAIQEQLLQGQGSEIKCQSCNETNQATSFCMDCAHFLCQDCQKAHERLAITKSHKIYTTAQIQSGEIAYKSKLRKEPKCEKHPDQNLNIYCDTCEQLVCTTCSVLKHEKHSRTEVSEAFDKCKQEIAAVMAKMEKKKAELSNAKKHTAKSRKKLDTMFEATNRKISQSADEEVAMEVARIREKEKKLKQEAKEIYQDRVKIFNAADDANDAQLTVAEQTLEKMHQLLAQEIKTEILHLRPKILHPVRQLTEQPPQSVPEKLNYMDFQASEETEKSLGRLILKDETEWRLKSEMKLEGKYAVTSVAVFSNNEIVTVNSKLKQLMTYLPTSNPQSPFSHKILQIPVLAGPRKVAVNSLDQLVVLDVRAVKILSREYQLLHQFQPGHDSDKVPTCLAVDENNLIAVGYKGKDEISLHKPDGILIWKLRAPMIEHELVITNKQLIYTNHNVGKLVCKDYNGGTVFEVDTRRPLGVCCNSEGTIFVAEGLRSSPSAANIHVFNADGEYIECVIKQCIYLLGMTFTPAAHLVMGGWDFLQIYHRV
ncbi:E3 ubiquitin-protein ligase TRIM33-like [Acanthaster planci]|uniref:E3 ubiquitin-protein ligase TRIM33-like n=1 Tax=Acanthaster planci TaxID=133434 RepID=A0A8B7Y263_ACAPL|nr:E3 ubiquitin-protein ligase TRIM33-like [Acanthaster planci]